VKRILALGSVVTVVAAIMVALVATPVLAATTFWTGTPSPALDPVFGTLIDFDDQATGTVVNSDDYVDMGVASITETELGATLMRYAGVQSMPNYVGTGFDTERGTDVEAGWDGTILIELTNCADRIGIGIADSIGIDTVTIKDPNGAVIDSQTAPAGASTYCGFDSDIANIRYLEIYGDYFAIDDLQFHCPVTVEKELVGAVEVTGDDDGILDLNEKWTFDLLITVTNDSGYDLEDLLVKDNFGGDLALIEVGGELVDQPQNKKDDWTNGGGTVNVLWTGKTLKAHMSWEIASIVYDDENYAQLLVRVETDVNPGQAKDKEHGKSGKNEYTSGGEHCLNSGPTVKVVINDYEYSFDGNAVCVEVGDDLSSLLPI